MSIVMAAPWDGEASAGDLTASQSQTNHGQRRYLCIGGDIRWAVAKPSSLTPLSRERQGGRKSLHAMPPNLTDWTDIWLGHSGDMCSAGRAGLWWEKSEVGEMGCDNKRPLVTTMLVACPTIKLGPKRRSGHAPRAPKQPPAGPRRLAGLGRRQLLASLGNLEAGPRRWSTRPHGSAAPGLGRRQRPVIN